MKASAGARTQETKPQPSQKDRDDEDSSGHSRPYASAGLPRGELEDRLWNDEGLWQVEALMSELSGLPTADRCSTMLREHLATGGKRMRARLALATLEAFGGDREDGVAWAAACELLHNATLIHDDLQDGDRTRRGQPTTWARHGVAQAINAGDLMLMLPFLAVDRVPVGGALRWRLARAIARRAACTVRGQSLEMDLKDAQQADWDRYLRMIGNKTGALFALPVEGAALITRQPARKTAAYAREFIRLGVLFQLQDDVLDLFGMKGRLERGADLREGKISALVIEHLRLHPADSPWLLGVLNAPRDLTTDEDVDEVITRFRDGGALAGVLERIGALRLEAEQSRALREVPELHATARALVAMTLEPIAHLGIPVPDGSST